MTMSLPSRFDGYERILPATLDDLRGPAAGFVALPLRLAWSGITAFDLSNWRLRLTYQRIIITEGIPGDPEAYLDRAQLIELWPYQRRMLGAAYRLPWETAFPDLRERAEIDVSRYDPLAGAPFQLK